MWFQLLYLIVLQVILLLLSPFLKKQWPFSIYYKKIYVPFLKDTNSYKWKYHLVPCFYFSIYIYLVYCYYYKVEYLIVDYLNIFERYLILPGLMVLTPVYGLMTMVTKPLNINDYRDDEIGLLKNMYPYDEILYFPGIDCSTCRKEKPARSKHCNICGCCILLQDHHCIWVNNCIGMGNYRYFYTFLILNSVTLTYAFLRLMCISFTKNTLPSSKNILILNILTGSFSVICGIFTYLQLNQVTDGMTTNETDKWFTIQELMRENRLIKTSTGKWYIVMTDKNTKTFYSTNIYDNKSYIINENYTTIKDPSEIPNIYDKGTFKENFKDFCKV